MKGIIEKGVYKSLVGNKQFEELVCKKGRTRRIKVLVLSESSMPMELSGKKINTPRQSLSLNKRSILLSRGHKLNMIFHHKTTSKKARSSFKRKLMHLKKLLRP